MSRLYNYMLAGDRQESTIAADGDIHTTDKVAEVSRMTCRSILYIRRDSYYLIDNRTGESEATCPPTEPEVLVLSVLEPLTPNHGPVYVEDQNGTTIAGFQHSGCCKTSPISYNTALRLAQELVAATSPAPDPRLPAQQDIDLARSALRQLLGMRADEYTVYARCTMSYNLAEQASAALSRLPPQVPAPPDTSAEDELAELVREREAAHREALAERNAVVEHLRSDLVGLERTIVALRDSVSTLTDEKARLTRELHLARSDTGVSK